LLSFLIGASQAAFRRYSIRLIVIVAILVNVGALLKRFIIVVPSLTYGNLLPYPIGSYSPSWVEYAVVAGLVAFGILMYILFMKVFPIMEVEGNS
jgi:molybdopterin-containing oxidoreductase family membrane subunit